MEMRRAVMSKVAKYDPNILKDQFLSRYTFEDIKDILINEHSKKRSSFSTEKAINLDKEERKKAQKNKAQQLRTVDFVTKLQNNQLLLCECKFQVGERKWNKNKIKDIKEKIANSKFFFDCEYLIICPTVILLKDEIKQTELTRIRKLLSNKKSIKPMGVEAFYKTYFE